MIPPAGASKLGLQAPTAPFFDTVTIGVKNAEAVAAAAVTAGYNLRLMDSGRISVALDETTMIADIDALLTVLNGGKTPNFTAESLAGEVSLCPPLPPPTSSIPEIKFIDQVQMNSSQLM